MGQAIRIQAIIFDMDGVLTDSEALINAAAVAMFSEKGLAVQPGDFLPFVGTGEDRYIGGVAEKYQFQLDVAAAKKRTYEIYLELVPSRLRAFPGAVELVHACRKAGLRIAVASSADLIKIEANLRKIELPPEVWDAVVCGDEIAQKKPAPDIFLAAARKLGVRPAECVVIEDAVNGIQAAKAAGMRCVAVAQTFTAEKLQEADLVRSKLSDVAIRDLVEAQPAAPPVLQPLSCDVPPVLAQVSEPPSPSPGRPWGFWATIGFTFLLVAADILVQLLGGLVFAASKQLLNQQVSLEELEANGFFLSLITCLTTPVVVALTWLFASIRKGISPAQYLGFKRVDRKTLLRWCLAIFFFGILSDSLTAALGRPIVPDFMVKAYTSAVFPPLLWFAVIVLAPVAEEIFFRGFVFKGILHSRLGAPGAILLTSFVWAVIHMQYDWYGVGVIFFAGLLLGYARLKTASIYPCIVGHAVMNLIATLQVAIKISVLGA